MRITVALIGQPNVGKSTLFNVLTHGNAIVTNWPGTTVERHEGRTVFDGHEIVVVDLPGVYSLTGFTIEEKISKNFLLKNKPDAVVVLVDSLALERTMYLAVEVLELTSKVVVAVTKVDEAHSRGIHINYELLEKMLKVPVVPLSAIKGFGIDKLLETITKRVDVEDKPLKVGYGELEPFINSISLGIQDVEKKLGYPARWSAIKILEGDEDLYNEIKSLGIGMDQVVEELKHEAVRRFGLDLAAAISRKRFEFVEQISRNAIVRIDIGKKREGRLASIFYNPYLAPIISVFILVGLFLTIFTINTGYPLTILLKHFGFVEAALWLEEHNLSRLVAVFLEAISNAISTVLGESFVAKLLIEGIFGGVSILLLFIPLIAIVLTVLGVFEDSGLLTRMAVGFHILLRKVGLSGHTLFPISLCLGCNVPGLMSTRADPNTFERVRLLIILPFIPCQARLVVLLAISSAVGGFVGVALIPLTYLVAFSIAIGLNMLIYRLAGKRDDEDDIELLLELPPIHKPIPVVVWWFTWFYLKHFIKRIGMVILLANVLVWMASNVGIDFRPVEDVGNSIAALISKYLSPFLLPLGVSEEYAWIIAFALMVGFLAKELFLTTLLTVTGGISLAYVFNILQLGIPSIVAITMYVTLYVPCLATLATIYGESRSIRLTAKSLIFMMIVAYIVSILAYNILELII